MCEEFEVDADLESLDKSTKVRKAKSKSKKAAKKLLRNGTRLGMRPAAHTRRWAAAWRRGDWPPYYKMATAAHRRGTRLGGRRPPNPRPVKPRPARTGRQVEVIGTRLVAEASVNTLVRVLERVRFKLGWGRQVPAWLREAAWQAALAAPTLPTFTTADRRVGEFLLHGGCPVAWPDTPETCRASGVYRFYNPALTPGFPCGVTSALAHLVLRGHDSLAAAWEADVQPPHRERRRAKPDRRTLEQLAPWYEEGCGDSLDGTERTAADQRVHWNRIAHNKHVDKRLKSCGQVIVSDGDGEGAWVGGRATFMAYSDIVWKHELDKACGLRWAWDGERNRLVPTALDAWEADAAAARRQQEMAATCWNKRHQERLVSLCYDDRAIRRVARHNVWVPVIAWTAFAECVLTTGHAGRDARHLCEALEWWTETFLGREVTDAVYPARVEAGVWRDCELRQARAA